MVKRLNLVESNLVETDTEKLADTLKELCKYARAFEVEVDKESDLFARMLELRRRYKSSDFTHITKLVDRKAKLNGFPTIEDNEMTASRCLKLVEEALDRISYLVGDMKKQNNAMEDVLNDFEAVQDL